MSRHYYQNELSRDPASAPTVHTAIKIADAFPRTIPTSQALIDRFGMAKSTAYRWVRTIRDARGQLPD